MTKPRNPVTAGFRGFVVRDIPDYFTQFTLNGYL